MMAILVPLWLLWLILLLVLTFIWVRQSKAFLAKLTDHDREFEFSGWIRFLPRCWSLNFPYGPDSELYQACVEYRMLLRLWAAVAFLVIVTRLAIFLLSAQG